MATSIMDEIHKFKDATERVPKKLRTLSMSVKVRITNVNKWIDLVLNQKDLDQM